MTATYRSLTIRLARGVRRPAGRRVRRERRLAGDLCDLIDQHLVEGIRLRDAAAVLGSNPSELVRSFSAEFGLPPHAYLTARRVDRACALLLAGLPPAEVATTVGFYDQAHLTRHFRRLMGAPPGRFKRSANARRLA